MVKSLIWSLYLHNVIGKKHTKLEKNLHRGFDKSADLLSKRQNHKEKFLKLCRLLRNSELYVHCK